MGNLVGSQFANSGFTLAASGLSPGSYQISAFGESVVTHTFSVSASARVTVVAPVSNPAMAVDAPVSDSTVGRTVTVAGWAIDRGAATGTGVDAIAVWAYPTSGAPAQFIGYAAYGSARPDIGSQFGSQFANAGFTISTPVNPDTYMFVVFARSTVTGTFSMAVAVRNVTVQATNSNATLFVDTPGANTTRARPFAITGWAVDTGRQRHGDRRGGAVGVSGQRRAADAGGSGQLRRLPSRHRHAVRGCAVHELRGSR